MTPVEWIYLGTSLGYMALEYWLGKTEKVKPGSVLEVLEFVIRKAFKKG